LKMATSSLSSQTCSPECLCVSSWSLLMDVGLPWWPPFIHVFTDPTSTTVTSLGTED
jgi:hypothetical protein